MVKSESLDTTLASIQVFDSTGSFLYTFDGTAQGATPFIRPFGVAVNNAGSKIYVSDATLDLVQVFGTSSLKVSGAPKKNVFLTQSEFFNVLRWSPPGGSTVLQYKIFRDDMLIATVSASSKLEYEDHNRKKGATYNYKVIAESAFGIISEGENSITSK